MIQILVLIANDLYPKGWEEKHTFKQPSTLIEADPLLAEMVATFNSTLRRGELPRRILSLEVIPFGFPLAKAKELALEFENLLTEANHEEEAECYNAADKLRVEAQLIERRLEDAGYKLQDL